MERQISELFRFLGRPMPSCIRVVEISDDDIDESGRLIVDRTRFRAVEEYGKRFKELMQAGYSWINLSYVGELEGDAIVAIELPRTRTGALVPSFNYSGPTAAVQAANGNVRGYLSVKR